MAKKQLVSLDLGGVARLINLPDPVSPQEPATKQYVSDAIFAAGSIRNIDGGSPDESTFDSGVILDGGEEI